MGVDGVSVRIAIRSDRRLFHDALAACLSTYPDTVVVGHVTNSRDLLDLCRLRPPDIVVFDAGADIAATAWSLAELASRYPRIRLIVTYEQLTRAGVTIAARLGIESLIPHSHGLAALLATLRHHAGLLGETPSAGRPFDGATAAGGPVGGRTTGRLAPTVKVTKPPIITNPAAITKATKPATPPAVDRGPATSAEPGLTEREREIITLLGAGHTAGRVAQLLSISPGMVESSKRRIYRKMGVASQSHAISRAATLGLMDRPVAPPPRRAPPDAPLQVCVLGPDSELRQRVADLLRDRKIPYHMDTCPPTGCADDDGRPPAVAVICDPGPETWPAVDGIDIPVLLVWSRPLPPADAIEAIGRGVAGIISATRLAEDLIPALALTFSGHLTISASLGYTLLAEIRARPGGMTTALPELTPREHDILTSIAAGHSVRQTARTLGIAEKTVENIQARLFRKLGVHNRAGAVAAAHGLGLLEVDPPRGGGTRTN
jgi:DNA-binding NarL/FixJ family response regulator